MPAAFVKSLFSGFALANAEKLILSGSAVVSGGNTIFLAFSTSDTSNPVTVTDNLGNTYSLVKVRQAGGNFVIRLYRADITNPGTLTAITIEQPPGFSIFAGIAAEFSGVGILRAATESSASSGAVYNAYPGGIASASGNYVAGDLWIGAFGQESGNTFATETGGVAVAALEPSAEQRAGTSMSLGMLYFTAAGAQSGKGLVGRFSASTTGTAVGAAIAEKIGGPTYNDTATGAIVFTGSRNESWTRGIVYTDVATGTLPLEEGDFIESIGKGYSDAPTGAVALSGARTEGSARADAPSGRIAFSGSVVESWAVRRVYADAPVGTLTIVGTRNESYGYLPSGRIAIGGTVTERAIYTAAVTGRIRSYGWAARTTLSGVPKPVGVPGDVATSGVEVLNPTILRPSTGSGYEVGDVLIGFASSSQAASLNEPLFAQDSPAWTLSKVQHAGGRLYLIAKVADTVNEPTPKLTFTTTPGFSGTPVMARIVAFRGLDTRNMATIADVVGATNSLTSAGGSAGGAAVTTVYDNDLVLSLTEREESPLVSNITPPAGFGLVTWDLIDSGARMATAWAYQVKKPAGAVAAPVFVVNTTIQQAYISYGVVVALKALAADEHFSTPSGTIPITGSRVEHRVYPDAPTGRIAVAGAITAETHVHRPQITGVLKLSGTVQESWRHVGARSGSIALSGSVDETWNHIHVSYGDLPITGTAVESYKLNNYDTCTGVLRLAGVAAQDLAFNDGPGGLLRVSGLNSESIVIDGAIFYDDYPAGLLELDGQLVTVRYGLFAGRPGRVIAEPLTGRVVTNIGSGRVAVSLTGRSLGAY